VAIVVMVVVVGRWSLRGMFFGVQFYSEASPGKMLASETKIARLISWALARKRTPKLRNLDFKSTDIIIIKYTLRPILAAFVYR
jgi:hypothetical protein